MFEAYRGTGVEISGEGVSYLLQRFNTIQALAEELEEELGLRDRGRGERQPLAGANVVLFPVPTDPTRVSSLFSKRGEQNDRQD